MLKLGKKKGDKNAEAQPPAVADGADAAEGEEGAPKKKKIPLLFIIIPAAVLLLGGGGAAAFFLLQPKPPAAEGDAEAEKAEKKDEKAKKDKKKDEKGAKGGEDEVSSTGVITEGPDGTTFYSLPKMVVNIQSPDGRPTFLALKLTLETQDAAVAEQLQGDYPRLLDMFQAFLRELRAEDMSGSAGTYQLRVEILRRVNMLAAPGKVDAVLVEEMLVQ